VTIALFTLHTYPNQYLDPDPEDTNKLDPEIYILLWIQSRSSSLMFVTVISRY